MFAIKLFIISFFVFNILLAQTPQFVKIPGGIYFMGTDSGRRNEIPKHEITLSPFKISQTEITVEQYKLFSFEKGLDMPSEPSWGFIDNHPIVNVTWYDAVAYCKWLGDRLKQNVQLPSEAQWEFAAAEGRRMRKHIYSGGTKMETLGWTREDLDNLTHPVATKKANKYGLYDMNGNVWEWCSDWYSDVYYSQCSANDPENTNLGPKIDKVARGGGWGSEVTTTTITHRENYKPNSSFKDRGFRVVIY